ncbi:recombinase family protein [Streptomyces fulvoviolaceus]|uniref:recombinase family protein n=1 Tax=Streptomyces fulvoviolaceus TaxID=285535 RepID=UPI0021BEFA62|nr:recombinase family protein [Streptomyces fulvoviolaceus]MCT9078772.1 recombinase family protein [Streptomyces fulvoviolaceus]
MAAIVAQIRILIFLYARISEDPREQRRGVGRQMKDLHVWAADLGGEIAGEWTDNDLSAHSGEERPGYDQLMAAALTAARQPGVRVIVAAYHPSRLWRRRVERAQAIEDLRQVKAFVAFESGGYFNMNKASDRSQLANLGESDTAESEVKSERVARAALERAEEGRANGVVAYGWRRIYQHDDAGRVIGFTDIEHPEQAAIVREIVRRLLSGDSLLAITADLNQRGIPAPGAGRPRKKRAVGQPLDGSRWNKTSVKKIALRKANVGLRTHLGVDYPAAWPTLITDEQHARLTALFDARAGSGEKPGQRAHLLSWGEVTTCGECKGAIRVALRGNSKRGARKPTYVCSDNGCVGRNEEALDKHVEAVAVAVLSDPSAADVFKGDQSGAMAALERAAALRIRQGQAADDFADEVITRDQLRRITQKLAHQIAEALAEARRLQPVDMSALDGLVGPRAAEKWERLTVPQKRRALEALRIRVVIHRSSRRGPGFDASTVQVGWLGRELPG